MKYFVDEKEIILNRNLSKLDEFVLNFTRILQKYTEYVIVSGYVSILFGRSRATEDVDLLVPKMQKDVFGRFFEDLNQNGFECINTSNIKDAFEMLNEHAIRFSRKNMAIPNMEFKIIKNDLDRFSFNNRINVVLGEKNLKISNLEMQIAYKLYLGSGKDLEDAKHLLKVFEDKLNKEQLISFVKELRVEDILEVITKDENRFKRT